MSDEATGGNTDGGVSTGVDDWIKELEAKGPSTPESSEGGHVWDEHVPDDMPGLTDPRILPRTLDPETAARQNAEQEAGRQKAIEEGVDPQTAQLMYPDIDPNDPYKIN
jgi:hypothetical protein